MRPAPPFERDRLTWLAYWMLGYGAYTVGLIGPLMPFLREARDLTFTLGGVLTATVAVRCWILSASIVRVDPAVFMALVVVDIG